MGRPKKSDGEVTRARLLAAAELEFGTKGFDRARLEDIAGAADIQRSSLLYHFDSKRALYREVVVGLIHTMREALSEAMAQPGDAITRIDAIGDALMRFTEDRSAGVSMFVRELLDSASTGVEHVSEFLTILEMIEAFLSAEAAHLVPKGAPVRFVLLHLITSQALRVASGNTGKQIWGEAVDPRLLIRSLILQGGTS